MSAGRVAIVTGAGRTAGIGFAVARRLLAEGYRVLVHSWGDAHEAALEQLGGLGGRLAHVEADLADPAAPSAVVGRAADAFGGVDVIAAAHARSSNVRLEHVTAEELDLTWAVNARASVLLVQALAARRPAGSPGGRVVLFTSGQHLGPMASEVPYAISKGALHQMTRTLADAVAGAGITVNAVNPGPVDTGWAPEEIRAPIAARFPAGRWGTPEDIAPVVAWLASEQAGWITGQVIDAEGGFRRG